jgi:hypothetical protein
VIVTFFIVVASALFSSGFFAGTVWAPIYAANREANDYNTPIMRAAGLSTSTRRKAAPISSGVTSMYVAGLSCPRYGGIKGAPRGSLPIERSNQRRGRFEQSFGPRGSISMLIFPCDGNWPGSAMNRSARMAASAAVITGKATPRASPTPQPR